MTYELDKSQYDGSVFVWSDPCLEDTDGDGLKDNKDANKRHVYDNRFLNTNTMTECNTNDNIDKKIQEANKTYNTESNFTKFFLYDYYSQIIDRGLLNVIGGKYIKDMPNASDFLNHFLNNTGKDYTYDASDVINNTNGGRKMYIKNINSVMELCEDTVIDELYFISNPSHSFAGTNFSTTGCVDETEIAVDWWFSIGDADATMSIKCTKSGNRYNAEIIYNLVDFYDWEKGSELRGGLVTDGEMYELHEAGFAREFKSIGTVSTEISWLKGERMNENAAIE